MKKNILGGLIVGIASMAAMTSCIENVGNRVTYGITACTVVSSNTSRVIIQDDYTQYYYYADEFLGNDMNEGYRYILSSWTVNYDEQPSGAYGTYAAPLKLSDVTYEKLNTKMYDRTGVSTLPVDTVNLMGIPYISRSQNTYATYTYVTFSGMVNKNASAEFNLLYKDRLPSASSSLPDTLVYEMRTTFNSSKYEASTYEVFYQCFQLQSLVSQQPVKIYYEARSTNLPSSSDSGTTLGDGYVVITAPTISSSSSSSSATN